LAPYLPPAPALPPCELPAPARELFAC